MQRVILLGASNVTISFPILVGLLRSRLTGPLEILSAHGHGRSYGAWSRILVRALPGIKDCQLWERLTPAAPQPDRTLALITDVGNDILYGYAIEEIADWLESSVRRLAQQRASILLTGLPLNSARSLSGTRFRLFRSLFFPHSRLTLSETLERAESLNDAVRRIAQAFNATIIEPLDDWYGFDRIHIRRSHRVAAWSSVVAQWLSAAPTSDAVDASWRQSLRLWNLRPARRRWLGMLRSADQPVLRFDDGTTLSVY
jgi:hypothetical protein